jgi:hypothetical protein
MEHTVKAKFLDCDKKFQLDQSCGFIFYLLQYDLSDSTKFILFNDLGDIHNNYMKGL